MSDCMGGEAFEALCCIGERRCRIGVAAVSAWRCGTWERPPWMVFAGLVDMGSPGVACWCERSIFTGLEAEESVREAIDESFMMI